MDTTRTATVRLADGSRLVVTLTIAERAPGSTWRTVEHDPITDYLAVSFTGDHYPRWSSVPASFGQVQDCLPEGHPVRIAWHRWHLNDMRSHCAHQDRAVRWDRTPACAVSGYSCGSAWLVEPVPEGTVAELVALVESYN